MSDKTSQQRLLYRPAQAFRSSGAFGLTMFSTMLGLGFVLLCVIGFMSPLPPLVKFLGIPFSLAILFLPLVLSIGGRSVWEVGIGKAAVAAEMRRGYSMYRSGPFSAVPVGTPPPGLLATSRTFDFHPGDGSAPFALIELTARNFYTLVLRSWPQGGEWNVQSTRDRWVARLGDMLTFLGQSPDLVAVTITVETLPESGQRASTLMRSRLDPKAPAIARQVIIESVESIPSAEVKLEARIAITWAADTAFRKRSATEMGDEVSRRIRRILDYAHSAGVRVRPMLERELCAVARRSFSPSDELDLETGLMTGEPMRLRWEDCGPASSSDQHGFYLHDAARSLNWTMVGEPEAPFDSNVLTDLLNTRAEIPRKRVTFVYQPYTPSEATRTVNKDHNDARNAIRTHVGKLDERSLVRMENSEAARQEQARGAGLTRVSMIVTATLPVDGDTRKVQTLVTDLGLAAATRLKPAYDQQLAVFEAGLGLGIILAEESSVSDKLAA